MKRLVLTVLGVIVLALIGVGAYGYYMYSNFKEITNVDFSKVSSGEANVKDIVKDISLPKETKQWVEMKNQEISAVVETIQTRDTAKIENQLQTVTKENPYLQSAFYVDLKGNQVSTLEPGKTTNVSQEDYFKQVIAKQDLYISKPFLKEGTLSVLVAYPVTDDKGKAMGVVGGTIPVTSLNKIKEQIGL